MSDIEELLTKIKNTEGELRLKHDFASASEADCKRIFGAVNDNPKIHTLNLSWNKINDEGVKALAEALKVNHTLHTLNLSYNKINDEGAKALAEALRVNHTLHTLDLSGNKIDAEGTKALAEALKVNHTLHVLELSGNKIDDEGAKALAEALKENHTLHSLHLSYNEIADEGAKALAEALKINNTLHTLNLKYNVIGDEGVKTLAEALKVNHTLHTLDLERNNIGDEGAKVLAEGLKVNHTLHSLNLKWNKIGAEGAAALLDIWLDSNDLQQIEGVKFMQLLGCETIKDILTNKFDSANAYMKYHICKVAEKIQLSTNIAGEFKEYKENYESCVSEIKAKEFTVVHDRIFKDFESFKSSLMYHPNAFGPVIEMLGAENRANLLVACLNEPDDALIGAPAAESESVVTE